MRTALRKLEPHFGDKRFTLEELMGDDVEENVGFYEEDLAKLRIEHRNHPLCASPRIAAKYVGYRLLCKYNEGRFASPPHRTNDSIPMFLGNVGEEWSSNIYHGETCGCKFFVPASEGLTTAFKRFLDYATTAEEQSRGKRTRPDEDIISAFQGQDCVEALGYVLFKHHGANIRTYARMTLPEAIRFLKDTVTDELSKN